MIDDLDVKGLDYFKELCKIPHGSGNQRAISDYLKKFGEDLGLKTIQDEKLNVIIYKNGTGESKEPLILQGHMDMVCEKNSTSNHDFLNDEIKLQVSGDFITATNTTLGADNGVAIAYAMEILASKDLKHPPLEVVFTTDEETGMFGAHGLDGNLFKSKTMINIDNEDEGIFVASCAGGRRVDITVPMQQTRLNSNDFKAYSVKIDGLLGGHSGIDSAEERGNSNVLMARFCNKLIKKTDCYISSINGGAQDNAIPRECVMEVLVAKDFDIKSEADEFLKVIKSEYALSDKNVNLEVSECDFKECFTLDSTKNIVNTILTMPNGILNMNYAIKGLPETSTNLGVVKTNGKEIALRSALRSSKQSRLDLIVDKIVAVADFVGAATNVGAAYPGWEYKEESKIRDIFVEEYKKQTGEDAKILAIHAGLECGIFSSKIPGLDIISLGPTIMDPHTPFEKVDYKSMDRTFELIKNVLERLS